MDNQRVASSILQVIRHGLRWREALAQYGLHKTLYNRFIRWSRLGVQPHFRRPLGPASEPYRLMIDATHLKAHRSAASLLEKGLFPVVSAKLRRGA